MTSPLQYVRPNILALTPYSTARDEFSGGNISVWLDANENPYENGVNRYPDPHQKLLKQHISTLKGISENQIFVGGAGSDEAIDLVFRIFCEPGRDNVITIAPTYGVYKVAAATNNVALREVMLGEQYSLPIDALLAAADENTKVMWICSPNNPTGNAFSIEALEQLADAFNGIVVVDEAYVDFSPKGSMLQVLHKHPNVIVLQTFSKAWGMAGLRLGMAFAAPEIAECFSKVKYPYNVNGPTQVEVIRRIQLGNSAQVDEICAQRQWLQGQLSELCCVKHVYPSDANFFLVEVSQPNEIYDYLVNHGVIVRNRTRIAGCEGCLRITIGTPEENQKVIALLQQYQA
ncbi:MAG: histidinol-phosphate transaminase [Bacteroidaceae bacterium]|nr:histidinol-phosphate transaminase [Bacteroidaceae bacterium]